MPFVAKPVILSRGLTEIKSYKTAIAQPRTSGGLPKQRREISLKLGDRCSHTLEEECKTPLYNLLNCFQTFARNFLVQHSPLIWTELPLQDLFELSDCFRKLAVLFSIAHEWNRSREIVFPG